jgi:hypothetical protein
VDNDCDDKIDEGCGGDPDKTQALGGGGGEGGCSIASASYDMPTDSAIAYILVLLLPLILIVIKWLKKLEVTRTIQKDSEEAN